MLDRIALLSKLQYHLDEVIQRAGAAALTLVGSDS